MKQQKTTILLSKIYIIISILSLAYVSLMSLINPHELFCCVILLILFLKK